MDSTRAVDSVSALDDKTQAPQLDSGSTALEGALPSADEPQWVPLSTSRKYAALSMFCLSMFFDILISSAFFVFIGPVATDLDVAFAEQSWIITSYTLTFASFLLFFGRVSDLFSAKYVFAYGFILLGVLQIVMSFLVEQYSFFVVRALSGVAGACLVPSSYRLIATTFPPGERSRAYTIYGMMGSIANVTSTIIAGVISLIPLGGQMAPWRWLFRILAVFCIPAGIASLYFIPKPPKQVSAPLSLKMKWLDLPGVAIMLLTVLFLILALTLGASHGWSKAGFIVPIILSALLFPAFFVWENRIPESQALIPPAVWRIPNLTVLIIFATLPLGWWSVVMITYIQLFNRVHGESIVIAAVRLLPFGISAGVISVILLRWPKLNARPRWPLIISLILSVAAYAMWTQAPEVIGEQYWRLVFPACIIGSGGMQLVLLSTIVAVMRAAPAKQAGVVGAVLQTSMQIGVNVALSVQAGLLTVQPGDIYNFANVRASWYFEMGWTVVWLLGIIWLYRPSKDLAERCGGSVSYAE